MLLGENRWKVRMRKGVSHGRSSPILGRFIGTKRLLD
jgi:hypothetical protein